jgi:pimeloyl-ACP methyl ester carboxylesterase
VLTLSQLSHPCCSYRACHSLPTTQNADCTCALGQADKIQCPVMVIHGTRDDVVPLAHGKELFRLCKRPFRYVQPRSQFSCVQILLRREDGLITPVHGRPFWVQGAQHNDIEISFFKQYCQRLQEFVWSLDPKVSHRHA